MSNDEQIFDWSYDLTIEKLAETDDGDVYIAGYASDGGEDEDGEVMDLDSLKSASTDYFKNPVVKFMHDKAPQWKGAIGRVVKKYVDSEGTSHETSFGKKPYLVIKLSKSLPAFLKGMILDGTFRGLSIGGKLSRRVGNRLFVKSWLETSVVDVPSAKGSFFNVLKAAGMGSLSSGELEDDDESSLNKGISEESLEALKNGFDFLNDEVLKYTAFDSAATIGEYLKGGPGSGVKETQDNAS
jgi:hypothetical protein